MQFWLKTINKIIIQYGLYIKETHVLFKVLPGAMCTQSMLGYEWMDGWMVMAPLSNSELETKNKTNAP